MGEFFEEAGSLVVTGPDVDQEFVSRARSLDKRRRAAGRDGGFTWAAFLRDKPGGAALPKAVLAKQRDRFAEFLHACGAAVGDDDGSQGMAQAAAQVVFKHAAGGRGGSLRAQLGRVESSKQLTRARSLARELLEWQAARVTAGMAFLSAPLDASHEMDDAVTLRRPRP